MNRSTLQTFGSQYLRSLGVLVGLVVALALAYLAVTRAILPVLEYMMIAGTPEDPNWQIGIDLPNARGGCVDPDAVRYEQLLTGREFYSTAKGC